MKICGCSYGKKLAYNISKQLNIEYIDISLKKFTNGEFNVQIPHFMKNDTIFIVQSICQPIHDSLLELLLLVNAIKNSFNNNIIAIIPYLGYMRQDKYINQSEYCAAKYIIKLLESTGINSIITIDIHSENVKKYFQIPIYEIDSSSIFKNEISSLLDTLQGSIIIAPDNGSIVKIEKIAKLFNINYITLRKVRNINSTCDTYNDNNYIMHKKNYIIIDDIIDTGETIYSTIKLLEKNDIKNIYAFITHAVLSTKRHYKLFNHINKIFISNSIEQKYYHKNENIFQTVDISNIIALKIRELFF